MARIGKLPRKRLAHLTSVNRQVDVTIYHYLTYPVPLARPASGALFGEVYCGTCKTMVKVTVFSVARTKLARRRWLGLGLGCLLALAVGILITVFGANLDPSRHSVLAVVAPLAGLFIAASGGVFGIFAFLCVFDDDGVRVVDRSTGHSVRRAKRTSSIK
jgi:hypothetical protein